MIGWYVHHHGAGHAARLNATLPHLPDVVALTSAPGELGCERIELPLDLDDDPEDPTAGGTLHWVPVGNAGLRERGARIASWIEEARPEVLVVDVSVEVALLGRLLGVPTVVVGQRGVRTDPAHQLAYAQAAAVVAPWTAASHHEGDGLPAGTLFTGAISRLDGVAFGPPTSDDVLLLLGAGGHEVAAEQVLAAAASTPERTWHLAGPHDITAPNVVAQGPRADVPALLQRCSVVVGSAGGNVVAEVAAARRPYVCLPQERPFAEQRRQADALAALGVAEVRTAWPEDWRTVLAAAEARDPSRWALLHDGRGAERLASVVRFVATPKRGQTPIRGAVS